MVDTFAASANTHPFVRYVTADKIRGAIVGSALGDAIGLYTEFLDKSMSRTAYPAGKFSLSGNVTKFCNDSHRNKFTEGSWTDDTDHALLIILSYLHTNGETLSSQDLAVRLRIWIEQGLLCLDRLPLGIGRATGSVLTRSTYLEDPKLAAYDSWAAGTFTSAPNGSLMRTYPLGIMSIDKTVQQTFTVATDFSLVTHADPRCVVACCIATGIMRGILRGEILLEKDIDLIIAEAVAYTKSLGGLYAERMSKTGPVAGDSNAVSTKPPPFDENELYKHTNATSYAELELDDLRKQGYVYKCLGSAIFCLRLAMRRLSALRHQNATADATRSVFEDLITELVLEAGDADTNATVAGAFVGALLGFSALPAKWYDGLQNVHWLLRKADALVQVLKIDQCAEGYTGSDDADTRQDGGKAILSRAQLEEREKAFMEVYIKKTMEGKKPAAPNTPGGDDGQALMKKWKSVFGGT